jgi:hypothetical protein
MKVAKKIGSILPKFYRLKCQELLENADSKKSPEMFAGTAFLISILVLLFILGSTFLLNISLFYLITLSLLGFILTEVFLHLNLFFLGRQRVKRMEKFFPDVLILISANLRAGMTIDKSIWTASRPEFGPLSEELNKVGKDVVAGKPIDIALHDMAERINSVFIKQTMKLIVEGIKSGGKLESLLREIANDIRSMERVSEEIKTNLTMYVMFIFFAAGVASPFIFGTSFKFVEVSIDLQAMALEVSEGATFVMGMNQGKIILSAEQLGIFYICQITIIIFFASLLLGLIQKGDEREGLKYLPFMLSLAILIFFLARWVSHKLVFV